jgi:hypothetical protein
MALAKNGFIASVLRKESGAAVTPEEFKKYDELYFPQPGDNEQTLLDKKVLRENFVSTEKATAAGAWRDPEPLQMAPPKENKKAPPPQGQTKEWQGVTYKLVGDEWVPRNG